MTTSPSSIGFSACLLQPFLRVLLCEFERRKTVRIGGFFVAAERSVCERVWSREFDKNSRKRNSSFVWPPGYTPVDTSALAHLQYSTCSCNSTPPLQLSFRIDRSNDHFQSHFHHHIASRLRHLRHLLLPSKSCFRTGICYTSYHPRIRIVSQPASRHSRLTIQHHSAFRSRHLLPLPEHQ